MIDEKSYIINKKFCLILLCVVIIIVMFYVKHSAAKEPYFSCSQARADGKSSILRDSPYYNPNLDADHDGVACE